VLPDVGSTIVDWPGRMRPSRSAASIMDSAMRSLSEPPGLNCSHLQKMSAVVASTR
jgi:hypothetical protein